MTITYLGTPGSGLGFQLAGMQVRECATGAALTAQLKQMREAGGGIAFVDEQLAGPVMTDVMAFNRDIAMTIVLLANPAAPRKLAAQKMERLLVQAIGSDIFTT